MLRIIYASRERGKKRDVHAALVTEASCIVMKKGLVYLRDSVP